MEAALTQICQKAGILMERVVPGKVSITAGAEHDEFIDITGSLFKNHRAVRVRINILEPEDEVRKHNDVANMVGSRLKTRRDGIKEIDPTKDPDLVIQEIDADEVANALTPMISQAIAGDIIASLNLEDQIAALIQQQTGVDPAAAQKQKALPPDTPVRGDVRDQVVERAAAGREGT